MNVLVLTGKFGYGHMSAAYSVKDKILKENINNNVEVIDLIDYLFPFLNKVIYGLFNFLVGKCSHLYNFLNRHASKCTSAPLKRVMVKKIEKLLVDNKPDLIISCLPICSQYISAYKKTTENNITMYTIITDISVHKEWVNSGTSKYFVPSYETRDYLKSCGISEEQICVSGIPVKDEFHRENSKVGEILIMGGGLGLIPSARDILEKLDKENIKVNIILGNNKKLYDKLKNKYQNINVIGKTDKVYFYMNRATLIITKAGGVTMSEAIRSETPIVCIKPFLEQEIGNARYIEKNGLGIVLRKKKNIYKDILNIYNNEVKLESIRENMKSVKSSLENSSFSGGSV